MHLRALHRSEAGSPAASAASEAASGETVALRWRTRPDNQAEADLYKSISDEITASGIGLNLTYEAGNSEGSPYQDKLKTELSAGTAPDVFWIPGTDVADFAKAGLILNAAPQAAASGFNAADFYSGPMDQLQVDPATGQKADGFVWGVPRDVSTFALYLNLDLIDAAGAEDPRELAENGEWTWDKFAEVSKQIADNVPTAKGFGADSLVGQLGLLRELRRRQLLQGRPHRVQPRLPGVDRGPGVLPGPLRERRRRALRRGCRAALQGRHAGHVHQRPLGNPRRP